MRRRKLIDYLVKNYYENTCLAFSNERYEGLKLALQAWEDNQKETTIDEKLEETF